MSKNTRNRPPGRQNGFSIPEMLIAMTITLLLLGIAFFVLANSLNRKTRDESQSNAIADANQAMGMISDTLINAGFGLSSNGLVAADCTEERIRVRSNLNALLKQTTSGTVTDRDEDVTFQIVTGTDGVNALVRTDNVLGTSAVVANGIDNQDLNGDGDGDGLTFNYLDNTGTEVSPDRATRVEVIVRISVPEIGRPGISGYQPPTTKQLFDSIVLRNTRLLSY